MPRGATKREREYRELERRFEKSGRYEVSGRELRQIERYEKQHKDRKGVLDRIARARH